MFWVLGGKLQLMGICPIDLLGLIELELEKLCLSNLKVSI